jgi:hypothetical protein
VCDDSNGDTLKNVNGSNAKSSFMCKLELIGNTCYRYHMIATYKDLNQLVSLKRRYLHW